MVMISIMSMIMSILFPLMKHPLSMGTALIIQTIMMSMITGMASNTFWFSYILIIIMISGLLIMFKYMASVASNEKFKSPIKIIIALALLTPTLIMLSLSMDQMSSKIWSIKKETLDQGLTPTLIKMFNLHNMHLTILMVSYLLLVMIVMSYIVNVNEGSLRTKN